MANAALEALVKEALGRGAVFWYPGAAIPLQARKIV